MRYVIAMMVGMVAVLVTAVQGLAAIDVYQGNKYLGKVAPYTGTESAIDFYSYGSNSGHPTGALAPEKNIGKMCFWDYMGDELDGVDFSVCSATITFLASSPGQATAS